MNLLVLGGTVFLGRHFADLAISQGHRVTLFHRGLHGPELFPEATHLLGDRDGRLEALSDGTWDAVVDCCGYVPRVVRQSAELLKNRTGRYLFVSTISVYADPSKNHLTESDACAALNEATEEITGETYGALKALCEEEARAVYGDRALIIRPGLIAGPYDPTNRFTYWADRFAKGGRLLAPPRPSQPLQLIDARDLAHFMLDQLEKEASGTVNVTGPNDSTTWQNMLDALQVVWPNADPASLSEDALAASEVELWQELPLCLAESDKADGMMRVSIREALGRGLMLRPWSETARDTHAWSQQSPSPTPRHGLDPIKEARALILEH